MKSNQLKELLKHIILEVHSQFQESHDYDNFDDPSNVANAIYSGLYKAPDLGSIDPTDGGQVYYFTLHSPSGPRHLIKRTPDGRWFYSDSTGYGRKWEPADAHIAAKKRDRAEYARTGKLANEMIANKDVAPDVFGAVNVEEGFFHGDVKKKAKELFGKVKKVSKISHPESNAEYFRIELQNPDSHHTIRKDRSGKLSLGREEGGQLKFDQVEEETGTGAVAGYSTPFAFKSTGGAGERRRKKKKKHVKESSFLSKVKGSGLTNEKINPDGTYSDDMEDGRRSNRISGMTEVIGTEYGNLKENIIDSWNQISIDEKLALIYISLSAALPFIGLSISKIWDKIKPQIQKRLSSNDSKISKLKEMTTSGAAGGQPGGTIQVPAWGTKNRNGSPKAIAAGKKIGYQPIRSITNEGFLNNIKNTFSDLRLALKNKLSEKDVDTLLSASGINSLNPKYANTIKTNLKNAAKKGHIRNIQDLRKWLKISIPGSDLNERT